MADWQLGLDGGGRPAGPRPRRDPRLSPLKSALQKCIRRGMVDEAVAIATTLTDVPGGTEQLARRLGHITPEDVGWEHMAAVWPAIGPRPYKIDKLLDVVVRLACAPKQREAQWLANLCWERRLVPERTDADALAEAIEAADYLLATGITFIALEEKRFRGVGGIASVVWERSKELPPAEREVVKSLLNVSIFSGPDEKVAGILIALIDGLTGRGLPGVPFEACDWSIIPRPEPLPWFTYDMHTNLGGIAIGMVAKRADITRDELGMLGFWCESAKVVPELPSRWKLESLALESRMRGWVTFERAQALWAEYGPQVEDAIHWLQRKDAEKGRFV